jgi:hypothetical protein
MDEVRVSGDARPKHSSISWRLRGLAALPLAVLMTAQPAAARAVGPVLHELIQPDAREDLAMHVALPGDLPAAIETSGGVVGAPDPLAPASASDPAYSRRGESSTFSPDRDTRRPDVAGYDDPFTPSTAPFKRLEAFDAVRGDYQLNVLDQHLVSLQTGAPLGLEDDLFYADLVVDVVPDRSVRIPSVGPGARIVRARLGVGPTELSFAVTHDGADNWFLQPKGIRGPARARLVMELTIARAAFGGKLGDPEWSDLAYVPRPPANVARDATQVRGVIGVSRAMRPREAIAKLVQYFRGFTDSDEPLPSRGSLYVDLALSKRGVCRHRAFAFMVTAQSLGIPSRMVLNEAHAWVEVHDGTLWRRIDLGGAGRIPESERQRAAYEPFADAFPWPPGADPTSTATATATSTSTSTATSTSTPTPTPTPTSTPTPTDPDDRPPSSVSLAVVDPSARRGSSLHVRGVVRAGGEPCDHVAVEVWLRDVATGRIVALGTLATGDDGTFAGGMVVTVSTPLGDYDVLARTPGDSRCGAGASSGAN